MLKRFLLAAALLGCGALAARAADEAITLKVKKPAKGDVVKETKSENIDTTVNIEVMGQKMKQEDKTSTKFVYTDEVLEKGEKDPKPTKLKRTYETFEIKKMGKALDSSVAGKEVAIEKSGDKYKFTLDGKAVKDEVLSELLEREFNRGEEGDSTELLLPKKPVKAGDTWTVDSKVVKKMFGEEMAIDEAKVKITGKLTKVYDKDSAKFGVIEYTFKLPVTSIKTPMGAVDTTDGSEMTLTTTVDGCIDGTLFGASSKGKIEGKIGMKIPGVDAAIVMDGNIETKSEPVKKK